MLYAWTDDSNAAPYASRLINSASTRAISFVHNPDDEGIDPASQNSCDSFQPGYTIFLSSNKPFKTFCEQLADSEFANPARYHFLWHNCAKGVAYALKIAGINAIPSFSVINQITGYVTDSLPLFALTPFDVLYYLKRYQYHFNRTTDVPRLLRSARSEFTFWGAKSSQNEVVQLTQGISKKMIEVEDQYPELSPLFLDLYNDLTDQLKLQASNQKVERIKNSFAIFASQRGQSYNLMHGSDFALTVCHASILFSMLKCLLYFGFDTARDTHDYINNIGITVGILLLSYAVMKHNEALNNAPTLPYENAKRLNEEVEELIFVMKK